jgi:hypothetical protein
MSEHCKAIAYSKKKISSRVCNLVQHPLSGPSTIILNILKQDAVTLHIVNVYHDVPMQGHRLHPLFSHKTDKLIPTLFIGDFNTHSPLWSLPNSTTSSWAREFEDWMGHNGLEILNPPDTPTWFGSHPSDCPSILDLALGNEAARLAGQLSPVTVSQVESLASDHAALLFQIYTITNIELAPPPASAGYRADDEYKASWMREFVRLMPYAPTCTSTCDAPSDHGNTTIHGITVHEQLKAFNTTIDNACKATL